MQIAEAGRARRLRRSLADRPDGKIAPRRIGGESPHAVGRGEQQAADTIERQNRVAADADLEQRRAVGSNAMLCQPCTQAGGFRLGRSEEHTSELQSLMRISYAVFCLKKKKNTKNIPTQPYNYTQHKSY